MYSEKNLSFLKKKLGERARIDEPLGRYTTFKIGGPADLFYQAETEAELVQAVKLSRERELPFFILGGGSNVLISDEGFRGIVIKNQVSSIKFQNEGVIVGSGTLLARLVEEAAKNSLSGLEFCVGIPGTIGGAVVGNAGAQDKAIGDLLEKVRVLDEKGEIIDLKQEECQFKYRASRFQKEEKVILEVVLKLTKKSEPAIRKEMVRYLEARKDQPKEPSAGSIFKNPPPSAGGAGELIDQAGLRGETEGQAQISEKHANWIVNLGGASCQDVLELISLAKSQVRQKFNLELEEEIQIVDEV
jgi:UDP-N-acetylmuramate dehydrogenase